MFAGTFPGFRYTRNVAWEMRRWSDPQAQQWARTLRPLETVVAGRVKRWLPVLHYPMRVGEHGDTTFAFGLIWDWAGVADDPEMRSLLSDAAQRFYGKDENCPLAYEPSGEDFLSPCLAEADFMRRALKEAVFGSWLSRFMPTIPIASRVPWLKPAVVTDRADPKIAHLVGLNLSRAWMREGIAAGLAKDDPRLAALPAIARQHRNDALPNITDEHYEGGHWLGTFAVYLTTHAGLGRDP